MAEQEKPQYETNSNSEEVERRKQAVRETFREVGVEIEADSDLFRRVCELHEDSHFKDAVEMARIVEIVFKGDETEKRKLKLCSLLHDIGKSGELRKLFDDRLFKDSKGLSVREALEK